MARRKGDKIKLNATVRARIQDAIIVQANVALAEGSNPHEAFTDAVIDLTAADSTLLPNTDKWALEAMDDDTLHNLFFENTMKAIA